MIDTYCDFETRSHVNVKDVGAWKFAAHPSTFPLMFAALAGDVIHQWVHREHGVGCPKWLRELVSNPDVVFHAWNANFEIAVYDTICCGLWGWPEIPIHRWRDTAAKSAYANQPRALGDACRRLGVDERKDKKGKMLIDCLCSPQKAMKSTKYPNTKTNREKGIAGIVRKDSIAYLEKHGISVFRHKFPSNAKSAVDGFIEADAYWNDDTELMEEFEAYNRQDVYAERDVDRALPEFPESEQRVWVLDSIINARGIPIDRELCESVRRVYEVETDICNRLLSDECRDSENDGPKAVVERHTQDQRIKNWIEKRVDFAVPYDIANTYGIESGKMSLKKEVVEEWLKHPWGVEHTPDFEVDKVRRVLRLGQLAGGSGVKKYWSALAFAEDDDRARGQLLYYGAATGRWAGKGIQPHNMVREGILEEFFFDVIKTGDHAYVREVAELFGYTVNGLLRKNVRGLIRAPKGYQLIVSDFAGIEARVLQWLAGNETICRKFADPLWDNYVHTASDIFGIPYDDMMESDGEGGLTCKKEFKDKRQVGKIAVLALGYGMGWGKYQGTCDSYGVKVDESFAQEIVAKWRSANPLIAGGRDRKGRWRDGLWQRVEKACLHVVKYKGQTSAKVGELRFAWDRGYLTIRLPSGRKLHYYRAKIVPGQYGPALQYMDGSKSEGGYYVDTYGGKLVENIVQAISRDLLVHSAFLATEAGLFLIFHVHDELVALAKLTEQAARDTLHAAMSSIPIWAAGLPLAAETYVSERYTK